MSHLPSSISTDWPADAIPERWVESLFEKMLYTYGAKFSDQWKGIDPGGLKRQWAIDLGKFTRDELKSGFEKLHTCDWPPTLSEFKKLCRPAIDPTVAYYEALYGIQARDIGEMGTWSHPAIYWAAARMTFDLKQHTYSQIKSRWEKALHDEMSKGTWVDIPQPMIALPSAGNAPQTRDAAAKVFEELKADGVLKKVDEQKVDHKAWARKILQREAGGDKAVTAIQISFAKEALKNGEENGRSY